MTDDDLADMAADAALTDGLEHPCVSDACTFDLASDGCESDLRAWCSDGNSTCTMKGCRDFMQQRDQWNADGEDDWCWEEEFLFVATEELPFNLLVTGPY